MANSSSERSSASDTTGALSGIRVLDMSRMFPGAFCTNLLADLGAEVIKLEAPGFGDGMRAMAPPGEFNAAHTALNRGKKSIVFDNRKPGAVDVLAKLVASADVVVESNKPGQLDAMGMGFEAMRQFNPGLIWCLISGFGTTGPNVDAAGHDITYIGVSGLMSRLTGGDPFPPSVGVSLPVAGALAALGIVAALNKRNRTGIGSRVDTNMVESSAWMLAEDFARAASAPGPGWGTMSSRLTYQCADGRWVVAASNEPRTWAKLCEALNVPEFAGHRIGVDDEAPVIARLREVFATKPAAEWCVNPGFGGGIAPVNEPIDLLDDAQFTSREDMVTLEGSTTRVLANPVRLDSDGSGRAATLGTTVAPTLGQHTDAVFTAAGFSAAEIASMREAGLTV